MYGYHWLEANGIFKLDVNSPMHTELRPVFKEELTRLGLNELWECEDTDRPLLWAEGIRKYVVSGKVVADVAGGGFYTRPVVRIKDKSVESLSAIDTDLLIKVNAETMEGLVQSAIGFIGRTHEEYASKGYKSVVAFSGGKDSLVLLDLVQRALAPDQFIVIFGDTGMELSDTYRAVELAKERWPNLNFKVARSDFSAQESWNEFGPPGRRLRWCCSVHKSVPTLLLLRELTRSNEVRAVVFDGVRAEESEQRSTYIELSEGNKHINQVNCRPLLDWSSAEVFLYLLQRDILLNRAYRYGMSRVGCAVCPMSSRWRDAISSAQYSDDIRPLLAVVEDYARTNKGEEEVYRYVEEVKWGARMGGNGLGNANIRVFEEIRDNKIEFAIPDCKQNWLDVSRILGPIVERSNDSGEQVIQGHTYSFQMSKETGTTVMYEPYGRMDRFTISWLRGVANKVAYCVGCKTCMVECPTGAFQIDENRRIHIEQGLCVHCTRCIAQVPKGCWAARSLAVSRGGNGMDFRGMDRYATFGLRSSFLEHFFELENKCWNSKELGTKQYDSLRVWLRESEILEVAPQKDKNGQITELGKRLIKIGSFDPFVWAVIWTNLAYNSTLVKWYVLYVPAGETYEKQELVDLADTVSPQAQSSRKSENAVSSLAETMRHSPIGNTLEMGIPMPSGGSFRFHKKGWETPDAASLLYAFYRYAEKMNGHYDLTLSELDSVRKKRPERFVGIEPVSLFGLNEGKFRDIVLSLAVHYPEFIRVSFDADLDNIRLFSERSSLDVVDLVLNGGSSW